MREKLSTQDKLIQTASRLFQLQGYHATGLNQIVQESGAPKGSLYYHFPDGKEQLALESLKLTTKFVLNEIRSGINQSEDPKKSFPHFIEQMADKFHEREARIGVPIASIALEASLVSEQLHSACQQAYEDFQTLFEEKLLDAGYEADKAKELAIVINSMVEGAFLLSFTNGNSQALQLVAKHITAML